MGYCLVGSIATTTQLMWVYDEKSNAMVHKEVKYVWICDCHTHFQNPGLLKVFDEILVNAVDNKQRCPEMSTIKVSVNRESGVITVYNDGDGIPVVMHPEYNVYVPSLIFGQLLSGTNFDDSSKKGKKMI